MPEVLVPLVPLALVFVLLAVAFAIAYIMTTIGDVLRGIPVAGGYLADKADAIAQAITHAAGKVESGVDHIVGGAWHWMARYLDRTWHQIEAQARLTWTVVNHVVPLSAAISRVEALAHHALAGATAVLPRVRTLEREYHGIEHQVKQLERDLTKGIGHDLRIQVAGLEHDVTRIENKVLPKLRAAVNTAEADVTALEQWVSQNAVLAGTAALTGAVAWALSQLGLGGLRCNSLLRSLGNRGCGLWSGLEDLLGLFVDTLLLTNICDLLPILETAVSDVADPLVIALTDVGAGLCDGGIGAAPALAVPSLHLPANPGLTLNLP